MSPEERSRRLARWLGMTSLLCPALLAGISLLLQGGIITFRDDFTGFKGFGFLLGWGVVLLPAGMLAGGVALLLDRASWLARSGAALNALFLTGFLLLLARFAF